MMGDVAALTGTDAAAGPVLHSLEQARQEARLSDPPSLPAVFCPIWKDPYMSINHDTFVDSIIREAGGRNIFADQADRYAQITLAEVARRKPDIIILPAAPYHFRGIREGEV
jgi:ABC-type Fe3+-hydroxamate transport system substrate-binding protein